MCPISVNILMKRLFTFGCSYTLFYWPTWADILSINFDHYENWGWAGLGNRAIAERLAECHARNNFTPNDTIIIQWSTHLRFDWYNTIPYTGFPGWQTNGNVYSTPNQHIFNRNIVEKLCSEDALIMHTLNNILLTANFLDSIGCKWFFTSLSDIRNLGEDLDSYSKRYETGNAPNGFLKGNLNIKDFPLYKRYPQFNFYEKAIWSDYKERWLLPITFTAQQNSNDYWSFQADFDDEPWIEAHPSPIQHLKWLSENLLPKLDDKTLNCEELINHLKNLKSVNNDAIAFEKFLKETELPQLKNWPIKRLGF